MGNPITAQLVGDDFPGLGSMTPDQPTEKSLRGPGVPPVLKKHIDDISILVHGAPQILQLTPDPDKDLVDIERVAEPADDVSRCLVTAGGTVLRELSEEPDGERRGTFLDPFGFRWMVGELVEHVSKDKLRDRVSDFSVT